MRAYLSQAEPAKTEPVRPVKTGQDRMKQLTPKVTARGYSYKLAVRVRKLRQTH